jgi:hypothetical protein
LKCNYQPSEKSSSALSHVDDCRATEQATEFFRSHCSALALVNDAAETTLQAVYCASWKREGMSHCGNVLWAACLAGPRSGVGFLQDDWFGAMKKTISFCRLASASGFHLASYPMVLNPFSRCVSHTRRESEAHHFEKLQFLSGHMTTSVNDRIALGSLESL